ncbi:MAG: PHP domain-containing protein [Planctomycetes bacterium]|nr:PHP domain-containing protein [Planctomycetota bacterium]
MRLDFHLHTDRSDGQLSPHELLAAVRRERVDAWAVTDHDSLAAFGELRGQAGLVPGVEVTSSHEGREVHVVGLGIDPDDRGLGEFLAGIRSQRRIRLVALIARLPASASRGLAITDLDDGRAEALGRNHLARALVRLGSVPTLQRAFADHLADEHIADPTLPQFPELPLVTAAIRAAGGLAILAHPGIYGSRAAVEPLAAHCDGLELAHPGLDPTLASQFAALCDERGLFMSVGSDLHFLGGRRPGMLAIDDARVRPLLQRIGVAA